MVVFGDGGIGALEGCFVPLGEPFVTCPAACRSKGDETKGKRGNPKTVAKVRISPFSPQRFS